MDNLEVRCIPVGLLGTNCYYLSLEGRDDCILIDPGDEPERLKRSLNGKKLAAILLTHGHFDHIGGVGGLMAPGVELIVHENDAAMLQDTELNVSWMIDQTITCPNPTRTVKEGDVLHLAGMEITVLHTPGHTAGCVCYQVGSHLFTGDTMFEFGYGRTDLPTGSEAQLVQSLRRLTPMRKQFAIHGGHS